MSAPSTIVRPGVIAPNLTPFEADLSVAQDLYVAHAHRLLEQGCVALAPFGTTGEALSVAPQERIAAIEALIASGIDPKRLIPGTGLTDLPGTAALSRACLDLGCAAVMTLPPFYFKEPGEDGLFDYFAWLIEAIGRPDARIFLYHIPQVAGVGLPVPLVRRLAEAFPETIIGIKDSSGDWTNTEALLGIDGLTVYPGSELPIDKAIPLGAPGCISATANLNAGAIAARIAELRAEGQADPAAYGAMRAFRLLLQDYAPIPAQKRLLALAGGDARWAVVRPPLRPLSEENGRDLAARLHSELGFVLDD